MIYTTYFTINVLHPSLFICINTILRPSIFGRMLDGQTNVFHDAAWLRPYIRRECSGNWHRLGRICPRGPTIRGELATFGSFKSAPCLTLLCTSHLWWCESLNQRALNSQTLKRRSQSQFSQAVVNSYCVYHAQAVMDSRLCNKAEVTGTCLMELRIQGTMKVQLIILAYSRSGPCGLKTCWSRFSGLEAPLQKYQMHVIDPFVFHQEIHVLESMLCTLLTYHILWDVFLLCLRERSLSLYE